MGYITIPTATVTVRAEFDNDRVTDWESNVIVPAVAVAVKKITELALKFEVDRLTISVKFHHD